MNLDLKKKKGDSFFITWVWRLKHNPLRWNHQYTHHCLCWVIFSFVAKHIYFLKARVPGSKEQSPGDKELRALFQRTHWLACLHLQVIGYPTNSYFNRWYLSILLNKMSESDLRLLLIPCLGLLFQKHKVVEIMLSIMYSFNSPKIRKEMARKVRCCSYAPVPSIGKSYQKPQASSNISLHRIVSVSTSQACFCEQKQAKLHHWLRSIMAYPPIPDSLPLWIRLRQLWLTLNGMWGFTGMVTLNIFAREVGLS